MMMMIVTVIRNEAQLATTSYTFVSSVGTLDRPSHLIVDSALFLLEYFSLLQCADIVKFPYPREDHSARSPSKSPFLPGKGVVGQLIDRCISSSHLSYT